MTGIRTLIVDNYDSFTFNLYQLIGQVNGIEPLVVKNDRFTWAEMAALDFGNIVISPGPGRPDNASDFGVCREAILYAQVPVLGVCLGHQGIGLLYGATVEQASEPMHGRIGVVHHDGSPLYSGIPSPFRAVRYHSLTVAPELPACLESAAWTSDGLLMGLAHRGLPRFGVQYHPESICTEYGDVLLRNFRDLTPRRTQVNVPAEAFVPVPKPHEIAHSIHSRKVAFDPAHMPAVFHRLYGQDRHAFWLDGNGISRFSFMGGSDGPLSAFVADAHPYERIAEQLARGRCASEELPFDFNGGFVGYFAYDSESAFLFADRFIAVDHGKRDAWMVSYGTSEDAAAWFAKTEPELLNPASLPVADWNRGPLTLSLDQDKASYLQAISRCQENIRAGESYEICLTNRIVADPVDDPLNLYLRLRQMNPAPYSAFLRFGDVAVLSSSPERFLRIERDGAVESKPIKGTRPRGLTPQQDAALRRELAESEKERAENLMIVDLLRNDLGRVCDIGSVHVPRLMDVETYPTVHQLVSTVRGKLKKDKDAIDCVRAAFPGGSMTGAPKIRTMRLIEELETNPRGIYSGALGFLALNGTADLSIVIRTLICTPAETTLGIGGAIVALSDPQDEFEETLVKARGSVAALMPDHDDAGIERVLSHLRERGHACCEAFKA